MSGKAGDLSPKQADALKTLKANLQDVLEIQHDTHLLLRFLRVRKFDVKKAEELFRRDLEWRAKNRIDTIREWFEIPEVCLKYWPGGAVGLDKEDHIVWIAPFGNIDAKGILYSVKAGDVLKTNISICERLEEEQRVISRKLGRHVEGITLIADLENLNSSHMWKHGISVMGEVMTMMEDHYPDIIHQMFIVRPNKILPAIYFVFKTFLSDSTRKKIKVLGGNFRQVLLGHIDAATLPVHWGGTLTDTEDNPNMCSSKVNIGGKVPSFYFRKGCELSHEDMTTQELPGKRSVEIAFKVKTLGSILRYEFKTEAHDIAFGISRVLQSGKKEAVLDERRYNSHIVPEDGEVLFEEPGLYVVKFDNHGGRFPSKRKLSYWMEVIEPRLEVSSGFLDASVDEIVRDSGYVDETARPPPMWKQRSLSLPYPPDRVDFRSTSSMTLPRLVEQRTSAPQSTMAAGTSSSSLVGLPRERRTSISWL